MTCSLLAFPGVLAVTLSLVSDPLPLTTLLFSGLSVAGVVSRICCLNNLSYLVNCKEVFHSNLCVLVRRHESECCAKRL